MYKLNENIRIKVRTPVGLTESRETGPKIGQGTVSGSIISSVGLDRGVAEVFHEDEIEDESSPEKEEEDEDKVKYDNITVHPLLFQDDIHAASKSIKAAQITNDKMEKLMEEKQLDFNRDKSCFIISGSQKGRKKLQMEVERTPLLLYGEKMKQVSVEKYLGYYLSTTVECVGG